MGIYGLRDGKLKAKEIEVTGAFELSGNLALSGMTLSGAIATVALEGTAAKSIAFTDANGSTFYIAGHRAA